MENKSSGAARGGDIDDLIFPASTGPIPSER